MSNSIAPIADHPPPRRPRVREVSSRFMSPSPSPADLHKSPRHPISATPAPPSSKPSNPQRKLLLPQPIPSSSSAHDNNVIRSLDAHPKSTIRKQQRPLKENGCPSSSLRTSKCSRPDTPTERLVPSRFKLPLRQTTNSSLTDAAKLLHSFSSNQSQGNSCPNSPLSSSTPSLCSRSLNLPISSFKNSSLPPQPTQVDSRKGRNPQDQLHSFKLLHNHYLQWRYANAKAQASMHAQTTEIQNQFFSLGVDVSRLRDAVKRKQVELALLRRMKALSTILEAQMPYLDEWSGLEEDHAYSLSGATDALTNSLLRLPVSGNVELNTKDTAEALDSAVKTMETILHHVQRFVPEADEMDGLMSELATVIDIEKGLVEECGNLLAKTHASQVEDCSLRGHLMQLRF